MPDETPAPEAGQGQEPNPETTPESSPQGEPKGEPKVFDEGYVKELRAEAARHRKEAQEAKAKAQKYEDAQKSETDKAKTKAEREAQRADQAEAKLLRFTVAQEKDVPAKLVPLLTAATREELESQADLILENAKPGQTPDFDGGTREPAPDPKSPDQAHNDLAVALFGRPQQL